MKASSAWISTPPPIGVISVDPFQTTLMADSTCLGTGCVSTGNRCSSANKRQVPVDAAVQVMLLQVGRGNRQVDDIPQLSVHGYDLGQFVVVLRETADERLTGAIDTT